MKLPLEYSKLAHFFDAMSDNIALNKALVNILKPYHISTIIDFSCGTGSQVEWLENSGYKVAGVDISPALVKLGKEKGLNVFEGDMRSSYFGQNDAAIAMGRSIGHLSLEDFAKALINIARNLNDKGLFIFDNFNLDALTDERVSNLALDYEKTVEGTTLRHKQYSELDHEKRTLTSYDEFILPKHTEWGSFALRIYDIEELEKLLKANGFKLLNSFARDGSAFDRFNSESFIALAQKI